MDPLQAGAPDDVSSSSWAIVGDPLPKNPQHVGKFVSKNDTKLDSKEPKKKIDIEKNTTAVTAVSSKLKEKVLVALQWSKALPDATSTYRSTLVDLNIEAKNAAEDLHGTTGIVRYITHEKESIGPIMNQVQKLEIQLACCLKMINHWQAICEDVGFHRAYKHLKEFIEKFSTLLEDKKTAIDKKIAMLGQYQEAINLAIELPLEHQVVDKRQKLKIREVKKLHLELLQDFKLAARNLKKQTSSLEGEAKTTQERIVDEYIRNASQAELKIVADLEKIKKTDLWIAEAKLKPDSNLNALALDDPEIRFKKYANQGPKAGYLKSWTHWDHAAAALGDELEQDIGRKIAGLMAIVQTRRERLVQGQTGPSLGYANLQDELNYYQNCFMLIQTRLDDFRRQRICEGTYDRGMPDHLLDYARGLQRLLDALRSNLKQTYKFSQPGATAVFEASSHLQEHLKVQTKGSLQELDTLYSASDRLKPYVSEKERDPGPRLVDQYLSQTVKLLNEIHAIRDPQVLSLAGKETEVWDWLVAKKSIEALRVVGEREANPSLPIPVDAYIQKRMMNYLFMPCDPHDMELEVLLHLVKSDALGEVLYRESLMRPAFRSSVEAYDKEYGKHRINLERPCEILYLISNAHSEKNIGAYAQAWQKFYEYVKAVQGDVARKEQHGVLCELMRKRLVQAAEKQNYPAIALPIQQADLERWRINDPAQFIKDLQEVAKGMHNLVDPVAEEKQLQNLFEAILLRAIGSNKYALQTAEKRVAFAQAMDLIERDQYAKFHLGCSDTLKRFVEDFIMDTLISGMSDIVGKNARKLLKEGAIQRFSMGQSSDSKVKLALDALIDEEKSLLEANREYTAAVIRHRGEKALKELQVSVQAFTQGSKISQAVFIAIEKEASQQRPTNALVERLSKVLGSDGYKTWHREVTKLQLNKANH